MTDINNILQATNHRPYQLPNGQWTYYQEWNRAVFLHWKVPVATLRPHVPHELKIDTFEGSAYVSLVAFTMEGIRPRYLPSVKFISCFDEINLRTYIDHGHRKGVYFLSIESGKLLSSLVARRLSGLPYEKSDIIRTGNRYHSENSKKSFRLNLSYHIGERIAEKTALDHWLTERYCLYIDQRQQVYRYDIHHKPWELNHVSIDNQAFDYRVGDFNLAAVPDLTHYSNGVNVIAWKQVKV